jgi:hypothetical protein
MTLPEVESNLKNMFVDRDLQIKEYVSGIYDYDNEDAYENITMSELEEDFKLFLTFYEGSLDT